MSLVTTTVTTTETPVIGSAAELLKKAVRSQKQRKAPTEATEPSKAPEATQVAPAAKTEPTVPAKAKKSMLFAAMRRFVKKYGRGKIEVSLRRAAQEERGYTAPFSDDAVITLLTKENPHRKGTKNYKRYNKYRDGMTIGEAMKAGIERANIRYLRSLGHLEVN